LEIAVRLKTFVVNFSGNGFRISLAEFFLISRKVDDTRSVKATITAFVRIKNEPESVTDGVIVKNFITIELDALVRK
jgi:hypothetical protein